jgi:hypothetical protein
MCAFAPAFVFLSHRRDATVLAAFRQFASAAARRGPVHFLYHDRGDAHALPWHLPAVTFQDHDLGALGLPTLGASVLPGNTHFPVLHFARLHPGFSHYWVVEYDVRFSGDWEVLFRHFDACPSDLLTCHIRRQRDEPWWAWWRCTPGLADVPPEARLRAFCPIYRISAAALAHVEARQREGWRGHYELLLPTLLYRDGFRLRDLGGVGPFVAPGDKNRFYREATWRDRTGALTRGTLRYRPPIRWVGPWPNRLYHPVK